MPFAAIWMDQETITLSKVSQTQTKIIWYHLHVEYHENDSRELVYRIEQTHRFQNQSYGYHR